MNIQVRRCVAAVGVSVMAAAICATASSATMPTAVGQIAAVGHVAAATETAAPLTPRIGGAEGTVVSAGTEGDVRFLAAVTNQEWTEFADDVEVTVSATAKDDAPLEVAARFATEEELPDVDESNLNFGLMTVAAADDAAPGFYTVELSVQFDWDGKKEDVTVDVGIEIVEAAESDSLAQFGIVDNSVNVVRGLETSSNFFAVYLNEEGDVEQGVGVDVTAASDENTIEATTTIESDEYCPGGFVGSVNIAVAEDAELGEYPVAVTAVFDIPGEDDPVVIERTLHVMVSDSEDGDDNDESVNIFDHLPAASAWAASR